MRKKLFIGREKELKEFSDLFNKGTASLVTCRGRRRIGKSRFIAECAKKADCFLCFTGLPPREGKVNQLRAFSQWMATALHTPEVIFPHWQGALEWLARQIPQSGKTVLLLDEISWMAQDDPDFPGYIKNAWDNYFSKIPGLVLVLCGSITSWIDTNILNNTGFAGRCSRNFFLQPLPIASCVKFLSGRRMAGHEVVKLLAVIGGIPKYLEEIDTRLTVEQNIARLCFDRNGPLYNEFEQIFSDMFQRRNQHYRKIARTLVEGPKTIQQIATALGCERGGSLTNALGELEGAGFLAKDDYFNLKTAESSSRCFAYRLADNFLRFHLKYIEPAQTRIQKGIFRFAQMEDLVAWKTILGLQFENLVLSSIETLLAKLQLSNTTILNYAPYRQSATLRAEGCQIDVLIRTKSAIYIIECKTSEQLGIQVIGEVKEKIRKLQLPKSLAVRTVLIHTGKLSADLLDADYFDFIISADELC